MRYVDYLSKQGSIAIAGECIKWLRDNLELISDSKSSGMFDGQQETNNFICALFF